MRLKNIVLLFLLVFIPLAGCDLKPKSIREMTSRAQKDGLVEKYSKIPHDEILNNVIGNRLYVELQEHYRNHLINLMNDVQSDSAMLVVAVVTTRVGKLSSPENTYGIPYILKICDNLTLPCFDFTPRIAISDISQIAQIGEESIWSKEGAAYVAGLLSEIIDSCGDYKARRDFSNLKKPPTFGDLPPNMDAVVDKGRSLSYKLRVNAQGLRIDHDLQFPKKKQRILLLGDSKVLCTYLDNGYTITSFLQKKYPGKEIINAGMQNYTMEDFATLYKDKTRYTEPDIVIVVTDGGDILEGYFTQRNKYSRTGSIYRPSRQEEDFYINLYGNK